MLMASGHAKVFVTQELSHGVNVRTVHAQPTRRRMSAETGLSVRQQQTARRNLRERGLLEEKLMRIPATLHFRVNQKKVTELLAETLALMFRITLQVWSPDPRHLTAAETAAGKGRETCKDP